jgi:predicted DNA-binding transcriptional regulator AlpA
MFREYNEIRLSAEAAPGLDKTRVTGTRTESVSLVARLLDAKQVASLLHVSESWVREHCNGKEPHLPAMKLGRGRTALVRFHLSDIEEFIQGQRERARSRAAAQKRW